MALRAPFSLSASTLSHTVRISSQFSDVRFSSVAFVTISSRGFVAARENMKYESKVGEWRKTAISGDADDEDDDAAEDDVQDECRHCLYTTIIPYSAPFEAKWSHRSINQSPVIKQLISFHFISNLTHINQSINRSLTHALSIAPVLRIHIQYQYILVLYYSYCRVFQLTMIIIHS